MNKNELVTRIKIKTGLTSKETVKIIDSFIDTLKESVVKGESIQLIGFGSFERRIRKARTCKNPMTGENIQVPESYVPAFKPGKKFKDMVNKS